MIVLRTQDPIHVSLDITEVLELSTRFQSLTANVGSSDNQPENQNIIGVLCELWARIVSPIVHSLRAFKKKFAIAYTSGGVLPLTRSLHYFLHAAGSYKEGGHDLSHFYPQLWQHSFGQDNRSLEIHLPYNLSPLDTGKETRLSKGTELPRVADESDVVAHRVAPILPVTSLADSDAAIEGALDALSRHQWLHLACHGMPNREKPFESFFAMRDGSLTITDIILTCKTCNLSLRSYPLVTPLLVIRQAPTRRSISLPRCNSLVFAV